MQTRFAPARLADPAVAATEQILRRCVHCGFCTATCPTYVLLGDELDGPRGRIYLIKEMLENDRPATPEVVRHLDRCLSCLACVTTCPSGVDYQHLIDHARVHVETTYRRPWPDRLVRAALAAVLPYPGRFRAALALARLLRPVKAFAPRRLQRVFELAGRRTSGAGARNAAAKATRQAIRDRRGPAHAAFESSPPPEGGEQIRDAAARRAAGRRMRVAVLAGCVQSVIAPEIGAAAARLLRLAGAEVVSIPGCCGAIVHHLGRAAANRELAAALITRLQSEIAGRGLEAIAVTASGCGTHVKDFGYLFRADPALSHGAAAVAERTRDVTELLEELGLPPPRTPRGGQVAYHSACSLQHGQRVERPPRSLLEHAGYGVAEIAEGHLCCGSAGTYNLLQGALADRLRDRKAENIARTGADFVAAGNIGCITQLASAAGRPVVHTVELLDWAHGGPPPGACRDARPPTDVA